MVFFSFSLFFHGKRFPSMFWWSGDKGCFRKRAFGVWGMQVGMKQTVGAIGR